METVMIISELCILAPMYPLARAHTSILQRHEHIPQYLSGFPFSEQRVIFSEWGHLWRQEIGGSRDPSMILDRRIVTMIQRENFWSIVTLL